LIILSKAQRAQTREGKLQVELAQLDYLLPRLAGAWTHLERLGGGIGTRGPGETQLESDRRRIKTRMAKIRRDLEQVRRHRALLRRPRRKVPFPILALVGYTNVGKSTLLNRLTDARVLVEDRLFSTLDPTTRKLALPDGRLCVVTDTVGFVRKLPHTLVEAFKSTLEEAVTADLLLHVVDGSAAEPEHQRAAVREVLAEIGAAHVPELLVVNKVDVLGEIARARSHRAFPDAVAVSGRTGEGLDQLLAEVALRVPPPEIEVLLLIPYDRGDVVAALHAAGAVRREEFVADGTLVRARLREDQAGRLASYLVEELRAERAP
jgi:GTP-binding protein HflX